MFDTYPAPWPVHGIDDCEPNWRNPRLAVVSLAMFTFHEALVSGKAVGTMDWTIFSSIGSFCDADWPH